MRHGAPALIRTEYACAQVARVEKRVADGGYGAPTTRRHCSGLGVTSLAPEVRVQQ